MANAPLLRDGMAGVVRVIWVYCEALYFSARDWTGQINLKLLLKFAHSRSALWP
jgi:hypothetical protein